ncbi:uncharacterized protein LOC124367858 [Homalodisca vitripennis]|uniref:uncharacterized protein LOC124367858 n=1 Tax=Homalodisca vitripennis TaxID=197043 RepID=UPI001EEB6C7A|nr:uncharacterized protein LOC124367858 [Homalodisca vitripennis]
MRYGDGSEKQAVGRKKKLNIPAGRSVTLADFDDPDEEETENERSENEDVPDNQEFYNYDSNEEGFDMEKRDEERSEDLAECISEGDWVKVRFTYDKGVKVFIGKVLGIEDAEFIGTFLRQSSKCDNIFLFSQCA